MSQRTQSTENVKKLSYFGAIKPVSFVRSFFKRSFEWKLLFGLLLLMGLRLITIIAIVLEQW